jgi:uncharacterized protein YoxC
MDLIAEIFLGVIGTAISFAIMFAGVGYYRQGKKQEILDGQLEELNSITLLRSEVETLTRQVKELSSRVEILTNDNEIKTKKLEEWMHVFQGVDPDMKAFKEMVRTYIHVNTPLLDIIKSETIPSIRNLQKYLDKQIF